MMNSFEQRVAATAVMVALTLSGASLAAEVPGTGNKEQRAAALQQESAGELAAAAGKLADILSKESDADARFRATVGNDLARVRFELGEYEAALEAAVNAAAAAESAGEPAIKAYSEFVVGMVHRNLKQYPEALAAFRASARLAHDAGANDQYLRSVNEESNVLVLQGDLDGAVARKLEALEISQGTSDRSTVASLENDLAFVYGKLGRNREALHHFTRSWQLNLDLGNSRGAAVAACNVAASMAALGEVKAAIPWAERGLSIAVENGLLSIQEFAHASLGDLLTANGEYAKAVEHLRAAYDLREKILNEESARRIAELGSRHEAERREAEISLLRRDAEIRDLELQHKHTLQRLLLSGIAALVAFLIVLAIAYRIKLRANRGIRAANRELEAARRRVEELSRTDPLTGLANRRAIDERLQAEYRRTERFHRPFSIVMVDIDHFKAINDGFGHEIGDAVLRELSDRLRAAVRTVDLVGRWGGEEFLLVLLDTKLAGASEVAEKVREEVCSSPFLVPDHALDLSITLGVAEHAGSSLEHTLRCADEALYRGKRAGRNRVVSAAPTEAGG